MNDLYCDFLIGQFTYKIQITKIIDYFHSIP